MYGGVCVCEKETLGRLLESWVNAGTKQCNDCPLVLYMHLRMAMNTVLQMDHTHTHTHGFQISALIYDLTLFFIIHITQQRPAYHVKS